MIYDDRGDAMNIPKTHIPRFLDLQELLSQKSHFLLGPRQTGKTSLVNTTFQNVRVYDLLDTSVYLDLSQNPNRIEQELTPRDKVIVIDEIQRLPVLLHEVHRLIEKRTYSSGLEKYSSKPIPVSST